MRYAIIDEASGVVLNVHELADDTQVIPAGVVFWQIPTGAEHVADPDGFASPGDRWDGHEFVPAPVPEPIPIRPDLDGFLEDSVVVLGSLEAANAFLARWPTYTIAMRSQDPGAAVGAVIDAAMNSGDLAKDVAEKLRALLEPHHLTRPAELVSGADVQAEQATAEG